MNPGFRCTFCNIPVTRHSIWASSQDEVPERVSQAIDTEKCLISILWFVNGNHSLVDVPKDSTYKVFQFEVSISAPRLDLGSKSQQILTLTWETLIWDFQPLGVKARAMPVDFSDALDVKPVH
jgi:hypothetical protein